MPLGTRHDETGRLGRAGLLWSLTLDGGGQWRIDGPDRLDRHVGRHVRVVGRRTGYDLLTPERLLDSLTGEEIEDLRPRSARFLARLRGRKEPLPLETRRLSSVAAPSPGPF